MQTYRSCSEIWEKVRFQELPEHIAWNRASAYNINIIDIIKY